MVILLMGVSGSGKTTVGSLLASELDWKFADADDYHSAENKAKMHSGIPLTDEDRAPWLGKLRGLILEWIAKQENVVLACSALKESYRHKLMPTSEVNLVFLNGSYDLISSRIASRPKHFMNPSLLSDQFKNLEPPADAFIVDVEADPRTIVARIRTFFRI